MDVAGINAAGRRYVKFLYDKLKPADARSCEFECWLRDFKLAHGELDTQRKINTVKLGFLYDLNLVDKEDLFVFIYCLDNYYALFLTLVAAWSVDDSYSHANVRKYLNFSFFREHSFANFHPPAHLIFAEDDLYLQETSDEIAQLLEDAESTEIINVDFIREVFHAIYPSNIRHSLGEFYTPDWLARHVAEVSLNLNPSAKQYLDPTCGSGTFLLSIYNSLQERGAWNPDIDLVGFDISPVSAFATKVNILINIFNTVGDWKGGFLNIFNANILDFEAQKQRAKDLNINSIEELRERMVSIHRGTRPFSKSELLRLSLMESIAPLFFQNVDTIVGNPPWVNWEYLPKDYKSATAHIWQDYGLFDFKGMNSIFIKEDISALITYVCVDRFLKARGQISFIVKESLFKSAKQATGFRKFYIKKSDTPLSILKVEDLTRFKPFYDVNNKTVIFYAKKGEPTTYPVEYVIWSPKGRKTFRDTESYHSVLACFDFHDRVSTPISQGDGASWASISHELNDKLDKYLGVSAYRARTGVFTGGANGIYWLHILGTLSPTLATIKNITERAKIKFPEVTADVEKALLFPYMSGSELGFWSASYSKYIICPHTQESKMYPLSESQLEEEYPNGMKYFNLFREELAARKGFTSFDKKIHEDNFYALQRIGDYTFAPYKVAWKYIASSFTCAVIEDVEDKLLGKKTVIPNEKIIYIGLNNRREAYYLCGLLSSSKYRELIDSFKISTQIAPSLIANLNIPRFNEGDPDHLAISEACERGHRDSSKHKECIKAIDSSVERMLVVAESQMNNVAIPAGTATQEELAF